MAPAGASRTFMRPLRDSLYGDLIWRRPRFFRSELVLEAGSERLASLIWPKWYSFDAVAESADGRWTIGRRRGMGLRAPCVVLNADSGAEVATIRRGWRGMGTARFASGAEYAWGREGFWHPRYHWAAGPSGPLITFRGLYAIGKSYEMTVDPRARALAELPVLVLLGTYVMALISAQARSA
jgi:hypothetical protein